MANKEISRIFTNDEVDSLRTVIFDNIEPIVEKLIPEWRNYPNAQIQIADGLREEVEGWFTYWIYNHDITTRQKFALEILEFSHDKNIRSDLDIIIDLIVEIKHTGRLRTGGEQYPNSESCYEAIEALKALKNFIKTKGEIGIPTNSYNGLEESKD